MPGELGPIEGANVEAPARVGITTNVEQAALDHNDPSGFPTATRTGGNDAAAQHAVDMRFGGDTASTGPTTTTPTGMRLFSEDEVKAIRQQEKDKLYGRMQEMEKTLTDIRQEKEKQAAAEETAKQAADMAEKKRLEEEMTLRDLLATKEQEWLSRFNQIEEERERERVLREKERAFFETQQYRTTKIEANASEIAPQLRDLITGDTKEEIDASINAMKRKTADIVAEFAAATTAAQQNRRGVTPTAGYSPDMNAGSPTANPELTVDDIRKMSMAQYSKMRSRLLGQTGTGGGMFS